MPSVVDLGAKIEEIKNAISSKKNEITAINSDIEALENYKTEVNDYKNSLNDDVCTPFKEYDMTAGDMWLGKNEERTERMRKTICCNLIFSMSRMNLLILSISNAIKKAQTMVKDLESEIEDLTNELEELEG